MHQVRLSVALSQAPRQLRQVLIRASAGTPWRRVRPALARALEVAEEDLGELPDDSPLGGVSLRRASVLGQASALEQARVARAPASAGGLELRVEHGPDAGRVWALAPGRSRIGRDDHCEVRLEDPAVSRRHAEIWVGPGGVQVLPAATTNGTWIESEPVAAARSMRIGEVLRIGESRARLALSGSASWHPPASPAMPVRVRIPVPPQPPARQPFPVPAMVLGLLVSVALAAALGSSLFLLLGIASPVLAAAHTVSARRQARREHAGRLRGHREEQARVQDVVRRELARQRERLASTGTPCEALLEAERPGWPQPAAPPAISLGIGTVASTLVLQGDSPLQPGLSEDVAQHESRPALSEVALLLALPAVLRIGGPASLVAGLLRWIVGQLALNHSPSALRLALFLRCEEPEYQPAQWDWFGWLPHADGAELDVSALVAVSPEQHERLARGLARLATDAVSSAAGPRLVLCWLLNDGPPAELLAVPGVHLVQVGQDPPGQDGAAPGQASVQLTADGSLVLEDVDGRRCGVPDRPGVWWADRLARALARRPPAGRAARMPTDLRLLDAVGLAGLSDPALATWIGRGWVAADGRPDEVGRTTVGPPPASPSRRWLLGAGAEGGLQVDLTADGPHFLVAGTTGAGKSELLRSMIAGLALSCGPEELAFVLVDYKGGAAFGACSRLPHVLGLLTDLTAELTARALTGLRAEIARRERLFADAGARSWEEYHELRSGSGDPAEPVPRLVIVVDEFRALAEDLPEFVSGLVRLAAVGRSLGLHLVLATQRPAGAISPEIRANITTRIALRMADAIESRDVVDCADAAALPVHLPGRAVLRIGGDKPVVLQCVRVDQPSLGGAVQAIEVLPGHLAEPVRFPPVPGPDDLERIVAAVRSAATVLQPRRPGPLWQPPLPELLPAAALPCAARLASPGGDGTLPLGLLDDPRTGRQQITGWLPRRHGPLAVIGAAGSGRRTSLRRILRAAQGGTGSRVLVINPEGLLEPWALRESGTEAASGGLVGALGTVPLAQPDRLAGAWAALCRTPDGRIPSGLTPKERSSPHSIPDDQAPHDQTTHEPTPPLPTPHEPTPHDQTTHEPTPPLPTPHDQAPHEPTPLLPTPHEPTPHEPTPHEPTPPLETPHELTSQEPTPPLPSQHRETRPDPTPPAQTQPALLVVQDWERVQQEWQFVHQQSYDLLLDCVRSASRAGVAVVISGGRALLSGQLGSLLTTRLVLRLADPGDAAFAGLRRSDLPSPWPPGRGVWLEPGSTQGLHLQVALDRIGAGPAGRPS